MTEVSLLLPTVVLKMGQPLYDVIESSLRDLKWASFNINHNDELKNINEIVLGAYHRGRIRNLNLKMI